MSNSIIGYDQINIDACTSRGISVTNAPTAVTDATADLTTWLILGSLRQLYPAIATLFTIQSNQENPSKQPAKCHLG